MELKERFKQEVCRHITLTDQEWALIADKFTVKKVEKGSYYIREHTMCNKLGFVLSGLLRTYTIDKEGQEITTHFTYEGIFAVSFLSFKTQSPSLENIQALTDVMLIEISRQQLEVLSIELPKWQVLYASIIEEAYACMLERIYILQNYSATEKYDALITQSHPDVLMYAQVKHISSYLGIQLETLSRIRKSLSKTNY